MIKDKISNRNLYKLLPDRIKTALNFLDKNSIANTQEEIIEIEGDKIYAFVKKYTTGMIEKGREAEAHRKYIDIHYCVKGSETIRYSNIDFVKSYKGYDINSDCEYFKGAKEKLILHAGEFVVFYPGDVHLTGISAGTDTSIVKILVKVLAVT